eukprot:scaffold5184_cov62-Alexandrium_tamarense.AAC.1
MGDSDDFALTCCCCLAAFSSIPLAVVSPRAERAISKGDTSPSLSFFGGDGGVGGLGAVSFLASAPKGLPKLNPPPPPCCFDSATMAS